MTIHSTRNHWASNGLPPAAGRVSAWLRLNHVAAKELIPILGRCERSCKAIRSGEREPTYL